MSEEQTNTPPEVDYSKFSEPQKAIMFLNQALPRIQEMLNNYPGTTASKVTQFRQILNNLCYHGLVEELPPIECPTEKELFDLMINVVQAKLILLMAAVKENELTEQIKTINAQKLEAEKLKQGEENGQA